MKKIFTTLMLILMCQVMMAGSMPHLLHSVKLQDGRMVDFTIMGTTQFSWLQTTTGEIIVQDAKGYRSATAAECKALYQSIDSLNALAETQNASHAKRLAAGTTNSEGIPSGFMDCVGSPKIAVLLVNFNDSEMDAKHDQVFFDNFFNGTGYHKSAINAKSNMPQDTTNYSSVRQYFTDMSDGKFTPEFKVYGPFTIDKTMSTFIYGDTYGPIRSKYSTLVKQACAAADPTVDFSDCQLVCIMVPKYYYQYTGDKQYINAQTGTANCGTYDGTTFSRYFVGAELGLTPTQEGGSHKDPSMGIVCHELCHAMGLPDVYPTYDTQVSKETSTGSSVTVPDITKYDNQSMEYWDLMDGGEHCGNGYSPTPLSYFEKWLFGWVDAPEAISEDGQYTIMPLIDENGYNPAKRIVNPDNQSEYWILENIPQATQEDQQNGAFGWYRAMLSYGMLVTHIEYERNKFFCGATPNNTVGHPQWTIIPADSVLYSSYHAYCSALKGGPWDWWFIGSNNVRDDHRTDTYPLTGTDAKSLYYIKTARINNKYQSVYLKNDSIAPERLNAYTTTSGLKSIHQITQDGGNGMPVTFIYGDYEPEPTPTGIADVNATDGKDKNIIKFVNDKGQIVIIKNGTAYNIAGTIIEQ